MEAAVLAYSPEERAEWVLKWPGQIVQAGDCIIWSAEVFTFHFFSLHRN